MQAYLKKKFYITFLTTRDAPIIDQQSVSAIMPIIGIGRLVRWYRPIVAYTVGKYEFTKKFTNFAFGCVLFVLSALCRPSQDFL